MVNCTKNVKRELNLQNPLKRLNFEHEFFGTILSYKIEINKFFMFLKSYHFRWTQEFNTLSKTFLE